MVILLPLLLSTDGVCDCRYDVPKWIEGVGVSVKARMMVTDEVSNTYRKHNFYLNWSNEVKSNGIYGGMHGKEWRR